MHASAGLPAAPPETATFCTLPSDWNVTVTRETGSSGSRQPPRAGEARRLWLPGLHPAKACRGHAARCRRRRRRIVACRPAGAAALRGRCARHGLSHQGFEARAARRRRRRRRHCGGEVGRRCCGRGRCRGNNHRGRAGRRRLCRESRRAAPGSGSTHRGKRGRIDASIGWRGPAWSEVSARRRPSARPACRGTAWSRLAVAGLAGRPHVEEDPRGHRRSRDDAAVKHPARCAGLLGRVRPSATTPEPWQERSLSSRRRSPRRARSRGPEEAYFAANAARLIMPEFSLRSSWCGSTGIRPEDERGRRRSRRDVCQLRQLLQACSISLT